MDLTGREPVQEGLVRPTIDDQRFYRDAHPGHPHPQPDLMMTRLPNRRLLALALTAAMAPALPALAQSADPFAPAEAATANSPLASAGAFTVSDIRVDGLQRISAGTVFPYLPIERGDTVDSTQAATAI